MLLAEILKKINVESVFNYQNTDIVYATDRSEDINPSAAFFVFEGSKTSGALFVEDAIKRGARVLFSEKQLLVSSDITVVIVNNARKTMAEVLSVLYEIPYENVKIIGITGTKGKTTTAEILYKILAGASYKTLIIGTLGIRGCLPVQKTNTANTTPSATVIYPTIYEAVKDGYEYIILEISSHAISQYRVWGLKFEALIFTSFSSDHIGISSHKNLDDYYKTKKMLFSNYPHNFSVTNADDPLGEDIVCDSKNVFRVGNSDEFEFSIDRILSYKNKCTFLLNGAFYAISIPGKFNAMNASLAIATAVNLIGDQAEFFRNIIKNVTVEGRYERFKLNGIEIIIDFAHNRSSFEAIMNEARENGNGKIISVFGSVGEREIDRRKDLAFIAEKLSDFSIITSDNPGKENPQLICEEIYSFYKDKSRAMIITDRSKAIKHAIDISHKGDTVLLLGKGHEEYDLTSSGRVRFSERELILKLGAVKESNRRAQLY